MNKIVYKLINLLLNYVNTAIFLGHTYIWNLIIVRLRLYNIVSCILGIIVPQIR